MSTGKNVLRTKLIKNIQHDNIQHNDTQHSILMIATLNITKLNITKYALLLNVIYYAEWSGKKPRMLNVIMLNVVMLNVFMLNVVMLCVVAPINGTGHKRTFSEHLQTEIYLTEGDHKTNYNQPYRIGTLS